MAGICGIISIKTCFEKSSLRNELEAMILKLVANKQQERKSVSVGNIHFGIVVPVNKKAEESFIYNERYSIYCIIEGLVYVEDSTRLLIEKEFNIDPLTNELEYIPYLYLHYGSGYINKLTGWYNIFIADIKKGTVNLSNDRLGLLPLFYFQSDTALVFASKIESILASGIMPDIEFDHVTIAEQLLYNYPVSNHTFIKKVLTLPSATQFSCSDSFALSSYWNPGELFYNSPLSKKKSLDLIDEALSHAILKPFNKHNDPVCVSLTGGWDGRLVLSYVLEKYRNRLRVFSFGAENSPDVTIPQEIARKEEFSYTPVILNQDYMDHSFLDAAKKTILCSNGVRSYRRSHYLYAMPLLAEDSDTIVTGNFGDEMLKFSNVMPSEVISKETILLIQSGFSRRPLLPGFNGNISTSRYFNQSDVSELYHRLQLLEKEADHYETLSQKYHHLKLTCIAPKYFGTEINSYNDYVNNFSPFLDFDFLKAINQTCFAGIHYPFNGNKLRHKEMSTMLYADLIKRNYKGLLYYSTDRGFSIAEAMNPLGKMMVYYKKKIKKRPSVNDPYFLDQANELFKTFADQYNISTNSKNSGGLLSNNLELDNPKMSDKLSSLNYWMNHIAYEYLN